MGGESNLFVVLTTLKRFINISLQQHVFPETMFGLPWMLALNGKKNTDSLNVIQGFAESRVLSGNRVASKVTGTLVLFCDVGEPRGEPTL